MSQYYLGFDAGTQSVKVAVYDENMNCIVSSSAPTTLTYPEPGWVSMDVDEYLALTIKGMKECASLMKEKGLDVTKIKSIMGDGIICGICGVDKDGNAITPYINYLDSRTKDDVDLVNSWDLDIFGKETGNPEANCMFPAMFARWFLKNIEGFKENGAKFIHGPSPQSDSPRRRWTGYKGRNREVFSEAVSQGYPRCGYLPDSRIPRRHPEWPHG